MRCDNLEAAHAALIEARRLLKDWQPPEKPKRIEDIDTTGRYFVALAAAMDYVDKAWDALEEAQTMAANLFAPIPRPIGEPRHGAETEAQP